MSNRLRCWRWDVWFLCFALASVALVSACGEEELVGPVDRGITVAGKPSAPSTGDPIVTATVPNTAPQDTTLDVQVSGSGFDRGSRVDMALDGIVSAKVKTNSTRFVNKTTLIANITIAVDADPDLYDILVTTTKGKRGIGIELFEISYAMTELGTLPGDEASDANNISETGEIVGGSGNSRPYRSRIFIWTNGLMQEVGSGVVRSASENRRVLGTEPASVWQEVGGAWQETILPTLPGPMLSGANGISPDGTAIVGVTGGQAVVWREVAGNWTIESLPGGGIDINANGMIVDAGGVWTKEFGTWTFHALTPLPGGTHILAWTINDHGDVVGRDEDGTGVMRAILWRKTPTGWAAPEYLGSLGGGSSATAINNAGHVVGYSEVPGESHDDLRHQHAFLWTPLDGMVDLGSRDTDSIAWDINDLGQIVGASRKAAGGNFSGAFTAVLWELQ